MAEELHGGHRARMKERFLKEGLDHFDRHQIVEMLLFFGIPRKDTNATAHRLIETFGACRACWRPLMRSCAGWKG